MHGSRLLLMMVIMARGKNETFVFYSGMKEVSIMADKKQYQRKATQSSDMYMEAIEREITRAIALGTIEIVADDGDE